MPRVTKPARTNSAPAVTPQRSVWRGPSEDGISYSLLSRWLCCRERFRCLVVEGLKPADRFSHRQEFGQLWHTCEEALAAGVDWKYHLQVYAFNLARRYPMDQGEVHKWYEVCKLQFPIYLDYWKKHPDVTSRQNLLREQVFDVPYKLPSGRTVRFRGKWDSVDLIGKGSKEAVYLGETKTKGDIDEQQIKRQLTFDLQTMMYLVALQEWNNDNINQGVSIGEAAGKEFWSGTGAKISGVRYNVVRRPLSGGKGTIVRGKATEGSKCPKCKGERKVVALGVSMPCLKCHESGRVNAKPAESERDYFARLAKYIQDEPETYFMRWQVEVLPEDVARFRRECLDPVLEQLCDWWEYILAHDKVIDDYSDVWSFNKRGTHWRHPFGVYNVLDEGGSSELDEYLVNGNETGLQRTNNLFPELS